MKLLTVSMRTLLLSACLTLTASADCGEDCAHCSLYLPPQHIDSIECVLECEDHPSVGSYWSLCKHFMESAQNTPDDEQESTETEESQQHQVDKKYGGFMKRYGGFMKRYGGFMKRYGGFMKRTAELYGLKPEDIDQGREILTNHDVVMTSPIEVDVDMKKAAQKDAPDLNTEIELLKLYRGLLNKAGLHDLERGERSVQKRYGGFMRRVGRPEWWQDSKRYGGFLKRLSEEGDYKDSPEIAKRYGGFMGY